MRIVIDARESGTSTGRYVDKLIEYLHKLKPDFEVVILAKSDRLAYIQKVAPGFQPVRSDVKEFTFAEQLRLLRQIKKLKPDLVHFTMTQQPIIYHANKLTTIHDLTTARFDNPAKLKPFFKFKQAVYKLVIKSVAKRSRAIITPSQFVKKDLAHFSGVRPTKICVTYEAADRIAERPKPIPRLNGKKFLMYVGRATPHKNLPRLVEAFEQLTHKYPGLYLVLAGKSDANYKKIGQLVTDKRLAHSVVFADYVSEGELRWLYENTAAYVFPSLSEGFGLPALEAMLHGAPVICAKATSLPEVCGDAALYFDPMSTKDMSVQIDKVLANTGLRTNLIHKGRNQAARYSWRRMAEQTLAVYKKLLE